MLIRDHRCYHRWPHDHELRWTNKKLLLNLRIRITLGIKETISKLIRIKNKLEIKTKIYYFLG
jgi:hypothetical protein